MGLAYIIRRVAAEAGISSPDLNASQKAALLDIINAAAKEIYESTDLPGCLREVYVRVLPNYETALPGFVGQLRAVRSCTQNYNDWRMVDMRPRYNRMEWTQLWKQWRLKGIFPSQGEITNTAPGTINYPVIDTDLSVTLVGQTTLSSRFKETMVQSGVSVPWANSYLSFTRIYKNKITDYDVTLNDADGNELAVIYANQLESAYQIIDVSRYPNIGSCSCACDDGSMLMEVLYKQRLPRLENDEDSFPCDGFDDAIVLKSKQLIAEDQDGQEQRALLMDKKVERTLQEITQDKDGSTKKKLKFTRRKILGMFSHHHYHSYFDGSINP